jgi:hypothetical protein
MHTYNIILAPVTKLYSPFAFAEYVKNLRLFMLELLSSAPGVIQDHIPVV